MDTLNNSFHFLLILALKRYFEQIKYQHDDADTDADDSRQ